MKIELQQKLFDKYPKIFGQKDLPMTQTCMCWGINCGDGWYWLIDQLCNSIQGYCDNRIMEKAYQVEAVQVKEKFGGLRFYINGANDTVYGMIDLAEHMSYGICEECGTLKNVKQRSDGWIRTLCGSCNLKRKRE